MGLYTKWGGRKPFGFIEGIIFGSILILFAFAILIVSIINMISDKDPWYMYLLLVPLYLYLFSIFFGCGVFVINEGRVTRKVSQPL